MTVTNTPSCWPLRYTIKATAIILLITIINYKNRIKIYITKAYYFCNEYSKNFIVNIYNDITL